MSNKELASELDEMRERGEAAGTTVELLEKGALAPENPEHGGVELFFDSMANALIKGDRVEIRGLCSFYVKKYKPYTGRNPKTGEKVPIQPKKLPFFKAGTELKKRVDG